MSRPIRTGVVGVGRLGSEHARVLAHLGGSALVGIHDIDPVRAREVGDRLATRVFPDAESLAAEAEAVVVAVPTTAHLDVGVRVLTAGAHALIEKPLARSLGEADALLASASGSGRDLWVGHIERFNGIVTAAESWIERPRYLEFLRLAPFQPRGTDVTVILDLMIHDIDLVLGLVGELPCEVRAVGVPVLSGTIDIANARLAFPGGAVATITASRASLRPARQLRIFQESGYVSLDLAAQGGELLRRRAGVEKASSLEQLVERTVLVPATGEPLARELSAFLRAVRGEQVPLATGEQARAALEVALGITREIEESASVSDEGA